MKRKQRFFKLSAIVGCILLGAGMLLCGAGFVGMGCNWNAFTYPRGGEPVAVSSFVEADAVDSIEIHASMGDVKIERASAANPEEVELVLAENVYQVVVQHGLLLVMPQDSYTATGQNGWNWYQLLNLHSNRDWDVTIRVPEKLLDSVFVETSMGTVDLSDLQAGSVTVQGDMGDVTLDNVSASESMTVTQSMGRVTLGNCQGGSLTLENDMGGTQVFQCRFESGNLQGSYGSCDVDESSFDALAVVTDMGDIHLTRSEAAGTVVCQAAQGSVFLERFASPDITLISDMGEVSGTIAGRQADYQITVDTDMGSSNLADQMTGGPNTLEVTTNMGNIELAFEE
ncbi:putative uncharacterized protein [Firmicutes bacterium CAG:94]|nr:putative uncharacterized protein [Firmicutes bacterium CAG:94]